MAREVRLPGELWTEPTQTTIPESHAEYIDNVRMKLSQAHEIVRKRLQTASEKQQDYYDSKLLHYRYKSGDIVWYRDEQKTEGVCSKLQPTYVGPCIVKENYSDLDYLIQKKKDGRSSVVHHNRLKPYEGIDVPKWIERVRIQLRKRDGH